MFGSPPLRVRRGPGCSCCRRSRVRLMVITGTPADPDYGVAVCPQCDRVTPVGEGVRIVRHPLTSAPKAVGPA